LIEPDVIGGVPMLGGEAILDAKELKKDRSPKRSEPISNTIVVLPHSSPALTKNSSIA